MEPHDARLFFVSIVVIKSFGILNYMKTTIREATVNDLESIILLNQKLCVKEHDEFDETIDPNYPVTKAGREYFSGRLQKDDAFKLVLENEGEIVGYFIGAIVEPEDYRTTANVGEGENMFIEPEYRSQGVGTEFMQRFESWCREKGVKRLRHVVSANNTQAAKLYKKLGFEEYDVVLEKDI